MLLADGQAAAAITVLRSACRLRQELDVQHAAATTRMLLAKAYRALGDEDATVSMVSTTAI